MLTIYWTSINAIAAIANRHKEAPRPNADPWKVHVAAVAIWASGQSFLGISGQTKQVQHDTQRGFGECDQLGQRVNADLFEARPSRCGPMGFGI